jgi:hypothetical protein
LVYLGLGEYKCEACGGTSLDDYGKVRNYIEKHGPNSAVHISEATGVKRSVVNLLLSEGRVAMLGSSNRSNNNTANSNVVNSLSMHGKMHYRSKRVYRYY